MGECELRHEVCTNGVVNVENQNYSADASAHIYSVRVEAGHAVGCSCPHATHRGAHCKHQQAVENCPLVVFRRHILLALAVATDGGHVENGGDTNDADSERVPKRSEQPDMSGGESTGPELL